MQNSPPKADIDAIFNRLRSHSYNKVCFDCNAKNPTWASITYGVFICIDCSAVHRSLGVHLTFVRSTNLDTNWNYLQLRQMQVGGNANASSFFRQHNCTTNDAQQKYNSRAAQLYRDKLLQLAQQACKMHGTKLHINEPHYHHEESASNEKDSDFFADCENEHSNNNDNSNNNQDNKNDTVEKSSRALTKTTNNDENDTAEPSVDFLSSDVSAEQAPKSSIGVRKIQPKKSGLGVKKGLGATKVKTNFADIEQRANMADQIKEPVIEKKLTEAEEAEAITSVRLAYQDLSLKKQREEDRLKSLDPNKAKQMERLGMGFNVRGGVSHSVLTDMQTINQDQGSISVKSSSKSYDRDTNNSSSNDLFDDFSTTSMYSSTSSSKQDFRDAMIMGFEPIESKQNVHSMFSPTSSSSSSFQKEQSSSKSSSVDRQPTSSRNNRESKSNVTSPSNNYDSESIQKKFSGAKGISSDQFFGNESSNSNSSNLSKFQGSTAISSADYFGDGSQASKRGSRLEFHTPDLDLDDVKDSLRSGVQRVAGKLSSLANNVNTFIQDKYGH